MSQHNRLTSGEERKLSPLAQYEEVEVVFPDTPHTDLEVPYTHLTPPSPEQVDYLVLRQSQAAVIYHDTSGTRKPWPRGFILLRSNIGGARATLRLTVRQKVFTPDLQPVTNINPAAATNVLLDGSTHSDTDATAPAQGALIVRDSAGKWIRKALGAVGTMLRSDGTDPQWSTDGSALTALNASNISSGTLADARLSSNVPLKDTIATIAAVYTFTSNPVFNANAIPEAALADDGLLARLAANETIAGTWTFTPGLKERGRSTAIGEWIAVAHAGGDYTASGSMTWTVASGDQISKQYTLIGETMLLAIDLEATTVGGTASSELRVAIPGGFTAQNIVSSPAVVVDNGTLVLGYIYAVTGNTYISFRRGDDANFSLSTNNTKVRGFIAFKVS